MNVSEWAESLLAEHRSHLSAKDIAAVEILVGDGEGWLAGYDLLRDGLADGWLTSANVDDALRYGDAGSFGKLWPTLRVNLINYRSRVAA